MTDGKYVVSWSGGKDSCLALYESLKQGYEVSHLVNFISHGPKRVRFHGTFAGLIQGQSDAMGIPLVQKETSWKGYEEDFKKTISGLKAQGVTGMIFGDIYVQEHLEWVERVCSEIGIRAMEPLWGRDPKDLLTSFLSSGFEAVVVCAKENIVERDWIGKKVDRAFMEYLGQKGIDFCGENGEYHTLVIDGPIFSKRLSLIHDGIVDLDGYYLLNTPDYRLEESKKAKPVPSSS
ncbi:MAG: diphthine--ammonia ligase [Dehalococcoidia bacterium]|nr:diphthine--ammonia ligase [Dehalococcoidia bacterium]MDD5494753.1 diphthine--ammonia ligase [Dehalococcoidia bacterium]